MKTIFNILLLVLSVFAPSLLFAQNSEKPLKKHNLINKWGDTTAVFGTQKDINIYNHPDFSFKYPESWIEFSTKLFEKEIILSIAPENEINEVYFVPESTREDGRVNIATLLPVDKDEEDIKEEHKKYFNNPKFLTKHALNRFDVSIEKKGFKYLSEFIEKRKERIKEVDYVEGSFTKINENHYINDLIIGKIDEDDPAATQVHKIHYHFRNGLLYTLVLTTTQEMKDSFQNCADLIFNTFEFKK